MLGKEGHPPALVPPTLCGWLLLAKSPFLGNRLIKLDFSRAERILALPHPTPWGPPCSCPSCPRLATHPGPGAATPRPVATWKEKGTFSSTPQWVTPRTAPGAHRAHHPSVGAPLTVLRDARGRLHPGSPWDPQRRPPVPGGDGDPG